MTDRALLRSGTGALPPLAMMPGELAYSPDDGQLWLGDFGGVPVRPFEDAPPELSDTPPRMDGVASPGVSAAIARADHVHPSDDSKQSSFQVGQAINTALSLLPPAPSPATTTPVMDGVAASGVAAAYARADHVHPHDSAKLDLAGGTMTGALTVLPPTQPLHPATRAYADALVLAAGSPPPASTLAPAMNGVAAPGSATPYAREDHVHPTDTSRYAASNPAGYQTAAQVTAALAGALVFDGGTF